MTDTQEMSNLYFTPMSAKDLTVNSIVKDKGLVVSKEDDGDTGKVTVKYGSTRGDNPIVEDTVEYDPTDQVEVAAATYADAPTEESSGD